MSTVDDRVTPIRVTPIIDKIKSQLDAILGPKSAWKLTNDTYRVEYSEKLETGTYHLTAAQSAAPGLHPESAGRISVARFELHPMINCCGICVSTRAWVAEPFRGRGLGLLLNSVRMDIARSAGYGLLLCTDVQSNEPQRKILAANGWRDIYEFVNPRTKSTVCISVVNL